VRRGRFITIEGGEGTGKSTQAKRLCDALRGSGRTVVCTREPGGSVGAEDIRRLLVDGDVDRWDAMTEALLHFAARRDHLVKTIRPALEKGGWVVSDRYADSTAVYQGDAQGLGRDIVERLFDMVVGDWVPDLTLVLDVPAEFGLARARARGGGRYERMDEAFHRRLREGFLDIARREPERCAVVDTRPEPDAVHAAIMTVVRERLGLDGGD
jgi:dTMP kinase